MKQSAAVLLTTALLLIACRTGSIETQPVSNDLGGETAAASPTASSDTAETTRSDDDEAPAPSSDPTAVATRTPEPSDEPTGDETSGETEVDPASEEDAIAEPDEEPTPEPTVAQLVPLLEIFPTDDWCSAARKIETNTARMAAADGRVPEILESVYMAAELMNEQALWVAPTTLVEDLAVVQQAQDEAAAQLADAGWTQIDVDFSLYRGQDLALRTARFNIDRYNFEQCGFDNGFDPTADPALETPPAVDDVDESDESQEPEQIGTLRDLAEESFSNQGFNGDEASCLAATMDFANQEQYQDPDVMDALFGQCGISSDRIQEIFG